MMIWKPHKGCSSEFLTEHHDLILYGVFHHIKAFLLFPPNCSCDDSCQCSEWRKKAILALNTHFYNRARRTAEKPNRLRAMKTLWHIPEDHFFRNLYPEAYPIWVIEKELKDREENDHFKIITQLVWTFLRLGQTYKHCYGALEASMNEALKMILEEIPLNSKVVKLKKEERLKGEKQYERLFKSYTSVCHFIAALDTWKKEIHWERVMGCLYPAVEEIERFLSIAHWFRKNLLILERRNVKDRVFLLEKDLCPLPPWVQSENITFPIEPFEEKVQEIWANAKLIDPKTKIATPISID